MSIINVNENNYNEEVLNCDKKILVDFWAQWCGPCKMIGPVLEEVATQNPDIKVVKVDVDNNEMLATKYQIMSIPTLLVIENGEVVNK